MKINRILLYNFSSFEGLNEFDFSACDEDRNIVLIGGKNGAGKTSLFTAIKIALYGPLCYGYVGMNPHYIAKVKDYINSKAFQTDKVEAYVELTLSLMIEREIKEFVLKRSWDYSQQKLLEDFNVSEDGNILDGQALSYFQNYLLSLIPPDLFDFFLFDGEAVGSIFSGNTYNKYVRDAVYKLCGLDIFEIIRKSTAGYVGKAENEDEKAIIEEYEALVDDVEELAEEEAVTEVKLAKMQEEFEQLEVEMAELETTYMQAGGITEAERKKLSKEYENAERVKAESLTKIKMFVEGMMPFYILRDFYQDIKLQLEEEHKNGIYKYISQMLDRNEIMTLLDDKDSEEKADAIVEMLLGKFRPVGRTEDVKTLFDLSNEELSCVNAVMNSVENFDTKTMFQAINDKKQASDRTIEINKTLKSAMTEEDIRSYAERQTKLIQKRDVLNQNIFMTRKVLESITASKTEKTVAKDRARQKVRDVRQNKHVYELSEGLANMMDSMLSKKSVYIKEQLERLIVDNLHSIYRKQNLITHIEIGEDFKFNLYQDASYTGAELVYLIRNLGNDEFAVLIGNKGKQCLYEKYGTKTIGKLSKKLEEDVKEVFLLPKNIDLARLSKGERQIFILSLYWAIIRLSGKDIPFIIDTPYARIDANHRKEISQKFFPNISRQVIILSTDEEINEEYYHQVKPYIAKEYLLTNDESQNRTSVSEKYFFGD